MHVRYILRLQLTQTHGPMCASNSCYMTPPQHSVRSHVQSESQVARLMKHRFDHDVGAQHVVPDGGMEFRDSGSESDDSGLRDLA